MKLKKITLEEYTRFYEKNKQEISVFSSVDWLKVFERQLELVGIFGKDGQLKGIFHYQTSKKGKVLTHLDSLPYAPHNGFFFKFNASNQAKLLTEKKKVQKEIVQFLNQQKSNICTLGFPESVTDFQPFIWAGYKVVPNYTYCIDLTKSEKDILASFDVKRRNDIKKAEKDNLTVKQINDYSLVLSLVEKTFSRKGKALNQQLVKNILGQFANTDNSFAYVCYRNEQPIATAFCIYDDSRVYYLLGGYDNENKHQGAGALCVREAIFHSKQLGKSIFDFEGSMLEEVEHYFRGFGGEMRTFYVVNKASFLIECLLKFIKPAYF